MYSESKIIVRYAETDRMGIVHHSVYPIWYEVARTDFIKKIGMTYSQMEQDGIKTPLTELTSQYKKPAYYEDEIKIRVKIGKLTPARIVFLYECYKEGELINTGSTTHAWVGKEMEILNLKKKFPDVYAKINEII